jgi:dihydromethanopterin reductase
MPDVRVMIAIGLRGQFGLNGKLPWEGDKRPEFKADVARFFEMTQGHVLLLGPTTYAAVPEFAFADRTIVKIRSSQTPEEALAPYADRVVFLGGGPSVYTAYARFIRHWDINRLPYDGEADRWFDPTWLLQA